MMLMMTMSQMTQMMKIKHKTMTKDKIKGVSLMNKKHLPELKKNKLERREGN